MAHHPIMIYIEGVIVRKPTLVLVDLGSVHNLMFEVFVISLGHPIGTMNPSRILLPNGQMHSINLFMKVVPI